MKSKWIFLSFALCFQLAYGDFGTAVLSSMNLSADACSDFYNYACGSWLNSTVIPADKTSYSRSFSSIADDNDKKLRELLEKDLQNASHPNAIAGRYFASCMEGFATGPLNVSLLNRFLTDFDGIVNSETLMSALGTVHQFGAAPLFVVSVNADLKEPNRHVLYFGQSGLGLGLPSVYLSNTTAFQAVRAAYLNLTKKHLQVAATAKLIPQQDISAVAARVLAFETALAAIHKSAAELRDPNALYNPTNLSAFPPSLHFNKYLGVLGINASVLPNSSIIVTDPEYLENIGKVMTRANNDTEFRMTIKEYMAFHLVRSFAVSGMIGNQSYEDENAFSDLISGQQEKTPRWSTCKSGTEVVLGEQLGEAFIAKHFSPETKKAADAMTNQVIKSFREMLVSQDWMDLPTRIRALQKLESITTKIGHPDKFFTYPGLVIKNNSYSQNALNAAEYFFQRAIGRLTKPVDKEEWPFNVFEVNAYYKATTNEIGFPAGILQPPFFSADFPDAMNYGAIGMVIGHEITHGFDDQGRLYDEIGRLQTWWSEKSTAAYTNKSKCFIDLYDGFTPSGQNRSIQGNLTIGENLADAGGIKIAFEAFKNVQGNECPTANAPSPVLSKRFTNHQLFFIAFAQGWCGKDRPRALQQLLLSGPHSPNEFRVRGSLSQSADFAITFNCGQIKAADKCELWA